MIENPLRKALRGHRIILASGSPRRRAFFEALGIAFEVQLKPVDEIYPKTLEAEKIPNFLARLKARPFEGTLEPRDILITSDTVVWSNGESLAKASNSGEAYDMLQKLSGNWHTVISSVCLSTVNTQKMVSASTKVKFKTLSQEEIQFYVEHFQPFDKAGAYGIQEWLGHIAIEEIQGSYNNVVGLPTHLVYQALLDYKKITK